MGRITNCRSTGDPYHDGITIIGWEDRTQALKFVSNDFDATSCTPPDLGLRCLLIGEHQTFIGYPYVVFYYDGGSGDKSTLLAIIQCAGDLHGLNIGSWGGQLLLEKDTTKHN